MSILEEAVKLITQSPGSLVYYLVAFFVMQQALISALTARRAVPGWVGAQRWVWGSGGLVLTRVVLVVLGLLGVAGLLMPSLLLPSLERGLLVATVWVLAWAGFLGQHPERRQTWVLLALLLATCVAYGTGAALQISAGQAAEAVTVPVWELVGILLALLVVLVFGLMLRPPEWEWGVGALLFWIAGTGIGLFWRSPVVPADGWLRLASLVALPLLSLMVQRQLLRPSTTSASGPRRPLNDAVLLTEIVQSIEGARDLDSTLILTSSRLAGLLQVEMCTLTLPVEASDAEVRVVAIHPPTAAQIDPPRLPLAKYAGLQQATAERQVVVANSLAQAPWLEGLCSVLGFADPLALAVVPLVHRQRPVGLLILGGPRDRRTWREDSLAELVPIAEILAAAIAAARERKASGTLPGKAPGQPPEATPAATEGTVEGAERQKLVETIEQAKKQVLALNGRIRTLLQEIKVRDEEILALNTELESRSQGVTETELAVWQSEVRQLAEEREVLERKAQELSQDRDMLLEERVRLTEQLTAVRQELEQVEGHRERLEEEVAGLQARVLESEQVEDAAEPAAVPAQSAATSDVQFLPGAAGLLIADEDGQITVADALARQMLRLPVGDVVGVPLNSAYPDARWAQTVDDLLTSRNGGPRHAHLSLSTNSGTVEVDLAALRGRDDKVDGLAVILRSSESDVERREALVGLANDFRTPMTAITGYTDLLLGEQAGILTEMQQQFLERVKANVEQLGQLLNDLIHIASPDSHPVELSPQPVNLIEIIEEAIMGLGARFRERRLAVQLDLPNELSLVRVDRDSLYQIMLRLLSNAVLCSGEGSQITVSAREEAFPSEGQHLRISVEDTGGGIAVDDYPRVFRRFYRANQPLVEGMGETGVGMAVAKALVEANGGRIWVDSVEGVGSTFSFLLPVNV